MKSHQKTNSTQSEVSPTTDSATEYSPARPVASTRDPRETPDSDGDQRTHEFVQLQDGRADQNEEIGTRETQSQVQILHSFNDPLDYAGTPNENALYLEDEQASECSPGWEPITRKVGSVANPSRNSMLTDSVYIDNTPTTSDIIQGDIGDCYYLAALTSIVASDPAKIKNMMTVSGTSATVTFFRYDGVANGGLGGWVPANVTINDELLRTTGTDGTDYGLVGSGFRVAENPSMSSWFAHNQNQNLSINEDAYYEAALWAPLLEKAYARFSEQYGQYGGMPGATSNAASDEHGNALSGYDIIDGGTAGEIQAVFYGDDALDIDYLITSHDPTVSASANPELIKSLLMVNGEGVASGEAFNLTASTPSDESMVRLQTQLAHTLAQPYLTTYGEPFTNMLTRMQSRLEQWVNETNPSAKSDLQTRVANNAAHAVKPGHWPVLNSEREDGDFRELQDLLLVVTNLGTDSNNSQRMVYADHEYTVLSAIFKDPNGAQITPSLSDVDAGTVSIDPLLSKVQLRNPHGTNEVDRMNEGPDGQDDGFFSVTLDQYARVFSEFEFATIRKTT